MAWSFIYNYPSQHPKRQFDRFDRFCKAHGRDLQTLTDIFRPNYLIRSNRPHLVASDAMRPIVMQFDGAYRRCSHVANASEAAPPTASSLFRGHPFAPFDFQREVFYQRSIAGNTVTVKRTVLSRGMGQTDKRTDGRIAASLNTPD